MAKTTPSAPIAKNHFEKLATPVPKDTEPLLTAEEVGRAIGVPANTIYKKALDRSLPSIKWGKLRRFRLSEVMAVMDSHRVEARQ
jgi:excisionase family DNA binding protein